MIVLKKETISSKSEITFLFKSKYILILELFIKNPDSEFFVNEIKRKTGLSPLLVVEVLKEFEKKEILKMNRRANAMFYRLNKESKAIRKIERIF